MTEFGKILGLTLEKAATTLVEMSSLTGYSYEKAWDISIHDIIKENFTFEEVIECINNQRKKDDICRIEDGKFTSY